MKPFPAAQMQSLQQLTSPAGCLRWAGSCLLQPVFPHGHLTRYDKLLTSEQRWMGTRHRAGSSTAQPARYSSRCRGVSPAKGFQLAPLLQLSRALWAFSSAGVLQWLRGRGQLVNSRLLRLPSPPGCRAHPTAAVASLKGAITSVREPLKWLCGLRRRLGDGCLQR